MKTFHSEYQCSFEVPPKLGEVWEYQIRPGCWIECEIISSQPYKGGYRYLARYCDQRIGEIKTGTIDHSNLRRKS